MPQHHTAKISTIVHIIIRHPHVWMKWSWWTALVYPLTIFCCISPHTCRKEFYHFNFRSIRWSADFPPFIKVSTFRKVPRQLQKQKSKANNQLISWTWTRRVKLQQATVLEGKKVSRRPLRKNGKWRECYWLFVLLERNWQVDVQNRWQTLFDANKRWSHS